MSVSRRGTRTEVAQELAKPRMAGTWALPKNPGDVQRIIGYLKKMKMGQHPTGRGEDLEDLFYHLIGDDDLFDEMGRYAHAKESDPSGYLKSCYDVCMNRIVELSTTSMLEGIRVPGQRQMMKLLLEKIHQSH